MSVYSRIASIVEEQFIFEVELTMETNFVDDLGADSLDIVNFIMCIEEEFGIEVNEEDLALIRTLGDIVNYFEKKLRTNDIL